MLPFAVVSSMLSSAATGTLLSRIGLGRILTGSVGLYALALLAQSLAGSFWVFIVAVVVLAAGSGAIDAGLNAFAARQFNAREITWLHAVYGLGAAAGPLVFLATSGAGLSWRWAFALVAALLAVLTVVFAGTIGRWPAGRRRRARHRPDRRATACAPAGRGLVGSAGVRGADRGGGGHRTLGYTFLTTPGACRPGWPRRPRRAIGSRCCSAGWSWVRWPPEPARGRS